ncbi:MAG: hypothetical protein ACJAWH_000783 [Maribacter sp.]|jgi:hypothetical protein
MKIELITENKQADVAASTPTILSNELFFI